MLQQKKWIKNVICDTNIIIRILFVCPLFIYNTKNIVVQHGAESRWWHHKSETNQKQKPDAKTNLRSIVCPWDN